MEEYGNIKKRADGSFEITRHGLPYHIPQTWGEWEQVSAYADAHPDMVQLEVFASPSLKELRSQKQAEILAYYDGILSMTKQGYSQAEIDTWETQAAGADDILNGETATDAARFVIALAAARQAAGDTEMTAEYLAQRIKANAASAMSLQAPVIGKQSAEWKAAGEATSQAELDKIVPFFDFEAYAADAGDA